MEAIKSQTLWAAAQFGEEERRGSLEPGKRADIISVDLRALHMTPLLHGKDFNVAAHLVFSASGHDVADVWVDGRRLVEGGRVLTVDTEDVRHRAQAAAEELFERRAALHTGDG